MISRNHIPGPVPIETPPNALNYSAFAQKSPHKNVNNWRNADEYQLYKFLRPEREFFEPGPGSRSRSGSVPRPQFEPESGPGSQFGPGPGLGSRSGCQFEPGSEPRLVPQFGPGPHFEPGSEPRPGYGPRPVPQFELKPPFEFDIFASNRNLNAAPVGGSGKTSVELGKTSAELGADRKSIKNYGREKNFDADSKESSGKISILTKMKNSVREILPNLRMNK